MTGRDGTWGFERREGAGVRLRTRGRGYHTCLLSFFYLLWAHPGYTITEFLLDKSPTRPSSLLNPPLPPPYKVLPLVRFQNA
jgi:hypothetical protein